MLLRAASASRVVLVFLGRGGELLDDPVPRLGSFRCEIVVFDRARTRYLTQSRIGPDPRRPALCNLYSMTTNQEAIRRLFRVAVDQTGNLPPLPGIYPDYAAPIVRNSAAWRELVMARWGMPTPPKFLEGKKYDPGVTNICNPASPHWRRCRP